MYAYLQVISRRVSDSVAKDIAVDVSRLTAEMEKLFPEVPHGAIVEEITSAAVDNGAAILLGSNSNPELPSTRQP